MVKIILIYKQLIIKQKIKMNERIDTNNSQIFSDELKDSDFPPSENLELNLDSFKKHVNDSSVLDDTIDAMLTDFVKENDPAKMAKALEYLGDCEARKDLALRWAEAIAA